MALKIPADVSAVRRKFAEAAAKRKINGGIVPDKPKDEAAKRSAGHDAAEARKKARIAEQSAAEKDLELEKLRTDIAAAQTKITELEPSAKRWNDFDHKRKERLIAKFPKEEQAKVRKFDSEALEALAEARGFAGDGGTQSGGGATATKGSKFTNMDELSALAKTDPVAYNKGVDEIAKGTIKMDKDGKVI